MQEPIDFIFLEIKRYMDDGLSSIDAVTEFARKYDFEIEVLAEYVQSNGALFCAITEDAERLNMIEPVSRLPI